MSAEAITLLTEIRDSLKTLIELNQIKIVQKRARKSAGMTEFQEKYCLPLYEAFPFARARKVALPAIEKAYSDPELLKLTGDNPDEIFAVLMVDVVNYGKWIEKNNTPQDKTAHPATWFNAGRYLD